MTLAQLERRLTKLEQRVQDLSARAESKPKGGWRKSFGQFADDPIYDEIMRRGRQYRRSLRPKTRVK